MKHTDWHPGRPPKKLGQWRSLKQAKEPIEDYDFHHEVEIKPNNFRIVESETEKCYVPGGT